MSSHIVKDKNKRLKRKIEKWDDIIRQLKIDISRPVNYITAEQIKQTCNEEPRLMAKIDTQETSNLAENLKQKFYQAYKVAYNDDNNNIVGI